MVIKNIHESLSNGIQTMLANNLVNLPYYGEFNLFVNFSESKSLPTCAVNVTSRGMNFYYNVDFLDKLTQKEINFIILHEDFHLLFDHPMRTVSGGYNHKLSNIVQDMIINHIIWEDITHNFVEIPKDDKGRNMALFVPKEYDGKLIFEDLYEWMSNKKDEYDQRKKESGEEEGADTDGEGESKGNGGSGGESKDYGPYGKGPGGEGSVDTYSLDKLFEDMDKNNGEYLDQHISDEVSGDIKESMVKDIKDKLQARGLVSGNIETTLNKLTKKRKDYLREIKRTIASTLFGTIKTKTITRKHRRDIEGLKGRRKIKTKINVGLDTSGSMGGTFERVLSYIYQNDIEINFMESDTEVRWVKKLKSKKQIETIPIKGLGGTCLQPMIDYIVDNFNGVGNLLLTDGYTDSLDFSRVKGKTLIISIGVPCPILNDNGRVKQIVIDKDFS